MTSTKSTFDADDDEELTNDEEKPSKRQKSGKAQVREHDHCDINFVKNTVYTLLAADTQKKWGYAKTDDPAPPVPVSRKDSCTPGDYLLIAGKSITLKSTGADFITTTFHPEEELILQANWDKFAEDMTGQDLLDLDDQSFLIWWQNIKQPPVPKDKTPTIPKKNTARRGTKPRR